MRPAKVQFPLANERYPQTLQEDYSENDRTHVDKMLDLTIGRWTRLTPYNKRITCSLAEDSAATSAVNGLNEKQRAKAYKLLADRREKIDKRETPQRGPRMDSPQVRGRAPD